MKYLLLKDQKAFGMPGIKISGEDHFFHENHSWLRALDFILQENAYLKTRLSHALDTNTGMAFVERAEHYQTVFIQNDEHIKDLLKDIRQHQELLRNIKHDAEARNEKKLVRKQHMLRNEMEAFEKNFSELKNEFNKYLVSML
jgi:hypothetical protein